MNKSILFLVIFTIVLVGCSQNITRNPEKNLHMGSEDMSLNDAILRDALSIEHKMLVDHKEKYGGYWIDSNNHLIVFHTGVSEKDILSYKKIVKATKVSFKKVEFSLSQLKQVKEMTQNKSREMLDNGVEVSSIRADIPSNRIVVGLYGEIDKEKKEFLTYFDKKYHKYFKFTYMEYPTLD